MGEIKKGDTKPRACGDSTDDCCFEAKECHDSGGKYQELKAFAGFVDMLPGSRSTRLHDRNYHKDAPENKPGLLDVLAENGPYENVSRPKRVM